MVVSCVYWEKFARKKWQQISTQWWMFYYITFIRNFSVDIYCRFIPGLFLLMWKAIPKICWIFLNVSLILLLKELLLKTCANLSFFVWTHELLPLDILLLALIDRDDDPHALPIVVISFSLLCLYILVHMLLFWIFISFVFSFTF